MVDNFIEDEEFPDEMFTNLHSLNGSPLDNNIKLQTLSPQVEDACGDIYDSVLDFAFNSPHVKVFALKGRYSSGKTSLLNSYISKSHLNGVLNVSLGRFDYSKGSDGQVERNLFLDQNRLEQQIINMIAAQVDPSVIKRSRRVFIEDVNSADTSHRCDLTVKILTLFTFLILLQGYIQLYARKYQIIQHSPYLFYTLTTIYAIAGLSFVFYSYRLLKNVVRERNFSLSKVVFKGTEVKVKHSSEESVLDRDLAELVYLIEKSGKTCIVFEDLDRTNNIDLFTKLRELNIILNARAQRDGVEKVYKFIFLIRDDLFGNPEDNTKFFDLIIPVVPVLDAENAESRMKKLLEGVTPELPSDFVRDISVYLDDMRMLKNIINEYQIYARVNRITERNLLPEKLFSLIALKNLIPDEFERLMQQNSVLYDYIDCMDDINGAYDSVSKFENQPERLNLLNQVIIESSIKNDRFIKHLILSHLIDRSISHYINFFDNSYITLNDEIFIRKLRNKEEPLHDYKIDNPRDVLFRLTHEECGYASAIHHSLFMATIDIKGQCVDDKIIPLLSLQRSDHADQLTKNAIVCELSVLDAGVQGILLENLLYSDHCGDVYEILEIAKKLKVEDTDDEYLIYFNRNIDILIGVIEDLLKPILAELESTHSEL